MNKYDITSLLKASIDIELGAAALYLFFSERFPEDRELWSQLHIEEKSHAMLIRAALDSFSHRGILPYNILDTSLEDFRRTKAKIDGLVNQYKETPPSRKEAFLIAIDLENESGERHYNSFMMKNPETPLQSLFQNLNREDKNHEERIQSYFENINITG